MSSNMAVFTMQKWLSIRTSLREFPGRKFKEVKIIIMLVRNMSILISFYLFLKPVNAHILQMLKIPRPNLPHLKKKKKQGQHFRQQMRESKPGEDANVIIPAWEWEQNHWLLNDEPHGANRWSCPLDSLFNKLCWSAG